MYSFASDEYIEQIVKTYSNSMFKAAYDVLKNRDDAEDAVQEAFIKLMCKHPDFNDNEHIKAWLLRVTINLSKNMLKESLRKEKSVQKEASYIEKEADGVLFCVMKLEENYRTVIHLYYYEALLNMTDGFECEEARTYAVIATRNSDGTPLSLMEGVPVQMAPVIEACMPFQSWAILNFSASGLEREGILYYLFDYENLKIFCRPYSFNCSLRGCYVPRSRNILDG